MSPRQQVTFRGGPLDGEVRHEVVMGEGIMITQPVRVVVGAFSHVTHHYEFDDMSKPEVIATFQKTTKGCCQWCFEKYLKAVSQ